MRNKTFSKLLIMIKTGSMNTIKDICLYLVEEGLLDFNAG